MNNTRAAIKRHWNMPTLAALAVVGMMAVQSLSLAIYRQVLQSVPAVREALGVVAVRDVAGSGMRAKRLALRIP